ncbi:TetR/AcrR family transcriptional regulator [Corynebacterium sp. ES2794-CONJ1]|uniref:TetR/AcrR family transcriptional regulator n=1 Tax=unclassified Corynebacterium TaxID=2624378 RepID=UPI0021683D0A|nr:MULTISPECIES: TetR/AcrR family transcriptional regulator [unclassified Corynebacterium]MCS4489310.1 TetR/AcrR family transcriptional regulator [Corynebacterium sp. ES2775-CONJ]MCS4491123.1 TetR/AcrR family transcriptional regulator [Corynebacterium sp. ES2715-CONJ3]MCS4530996.1 TetR/AcrR family transcriptional regulator [Corynebacterium sp. ES2730-CONJ]MCU9518363.1 TetR/AcrR family transcriptional regulator [Corynebacterium sp. ES2794-CONJ1]
MPIVSDSELISRRQDILDGARRCFAEYGYEGATVRRLERSIGKSRGAIFHHFKDKENLFLALAREDAERMAEVVSKDGLVEVMRSILENPKDYSWLSTRLEISTMLRTDSSFRQRWIEHQRTLDDALRERLRLNLEKGGLRTDVSLEVLHTYLETVFDGLITRLSSGADTTDLQAILQIVEGSVRSSSS